MSAASAKGQTTEVAPSRAQQLVARRMAESRSMVPDFTLRATVDMEAAVALRARLKAAPAQGGPVPSLNDLIIKASATALSAHPEANGSFVDGKFQLYERVNIGVAVAAPGALVVPVVSDANLKTLAEIALETRELAARARAGAIRPSDLSGGTFTVSNLGMFGIEDFDAVVNAPQAAILAIGQVLEQPVARSGKVVIRHVARLGLSCDHRILYGADGARFLGRIRELIENPAWATDPAPSQATLSNAGTEV